jgi:hypothetical protein
MSRLLPSSVVFVFALAAGLACETDPVDVGSGSGTELEARQLVPTEPGVVRTVKTWVIIKRAGSWQIVTQPTTAVAPTP